MRPRLPRAFFGWALGIVVLDQITKAIVHRSMTLNGEPIPLLGETLRLIYIHNPGAAFGLFYGSRWFFVGVSLLSVLVLISLVQSGRYRDRWLLVSFGMIAGGALGNVLDRLWLGVVIDFIQMGIAGHYWPVYNVADIGVTGGVSLLALRLLRDRTPPPEEAPEDPA